MGATSFENVACSAHIASGNKRMRLKMASWKPRMLPPLTKSLIPDPLFTDLHDANRIHHSICWRDRQSLLGHQLAKERCRFGAGDCGLNAEAHKTTGVIQRLPGMSRNLRDQRVGIAAASVTGIQFCAMIHEQLNNFGPAFCSSRSE